MHVFIIVSITADGFIARFKEQSSLNWTSREDKQFFVKRSKQAGVIVMGRTTFDTIDAKYKPLKDRLNIVYTSKSAKDYLPQGEWALDKTKFRTTTLSPQDLVASLVKEGCRELAICGGASIYTNFLQAGVVDTLYLTVEPVVFGDGIKFFNQQINNDLQLRLKSSKKLNDAGTLLLEYSRQNL